MIGWICDECRRFNGAAQQCRCGRWPRAELGRADDALVLEVPLAQGSSPTWPIPGFKTFSKTSFGGDRPFGSKNPERYHAGVDIHAPRGTVVVAMEPGTVVAFQGWQSPTAKQRKTMSPELVQYRTTKALLLELDSGPVIVYGALIPESWQEFGIAKGSRVSKGQPLGRVGTYPAGDEMLHIEARKPGARSAKPWFIAEGVPSTLLNVTPLLEEARKNPSVNVPGPAPGPAPSPATPPPADVPLSRERWLQLALRQLVDGSLAVDGKIGPQTRAAIKAFQRSVGLQVDGIAGPQTFAALEKVLGGKSPVWDELALGPFIERLKNAWSGAWKDVFG